MVLDRPTFGLPVLGAIVIALLFASVSPGVTAQSTASQVATLSITVNTQLNSEYSVFGSSSSSVTATVTSSGLDILTPTRMVLESNIQILTIQSTYVAHGVMGSLGYTTAAVGGGKQYIFLLPTNTTSIDFVIHGSDSGSTFLWRYLYTMPFVVESGLSIPVGYTSVVSIPSGSEPSQLFDSFGNTLPNSEATLVSSTGGNSTYSMSGFVALMIVQSALYVPVAIIVSACAAIVVAIAALNLFRPVKLAFDKIRTRLGNLVRGFFDSIPKRTRPKFHLRDLFEPKKLLVLFLLCSIVMVSFAALAGPDPRVKAYVVADPASVPAISSNLEAIAGPSVVVVTPLDDYTDFSTMASLGTFNIVIISNYPSAGLPQISGYILGSMGDVPVMVVDSSADPTFVSQINALYPGKVTTIGSAEAMTTADQQLIGQMIQSTMRTNVFGLSVSVTDFKLLLAFEGVLSFVLIFLGWAFLGCLISSSGLQADIYSVTTFITSGIFVFVFSEIIYIVTSGLLALPLSLHAVLSGAHDITAVGLLGFGGGSTPRLVAGFLGILIGVALTPGGPKLVKTDLALVGGIIVFLFSNPFYIGQFVYSGLVIFIGNYAFGSAYVSSQSLKGFIYGVGTLLGGAVSSAYPMSAGKMLYFAGLAPLAYVRRMSRTTTTILVLAAALLIGDGGVRVGEMTPYKTVIAVVPGLVVGFAFAALFIGLATLEKYVRGNWRSKT